MNEMEERIPLESLDPGSRDAGFWLRFHGRVMDSAQAELARRRMVGELGVVDVVFAWRKALVPMALLAAAMAGILMMGSEPEESIRVVALEEVLTEDLNLFSTSGVLAGESAFQESLFALAEGGF
jgi:hypothetical protein